MEKINIVFPNCFMPADLEVQLNKPDRDDDIRALGTICSYSSLWQKSRYFEWVWKPNELLQDKPLFFVDLQLQHATYDQYKDYRKFGWIVESPLYAHMATDSPVNTYYTNFFTSNRRLLDSGQNYLFASGACWIASECQLVYKKNKLASLIASSKGSHPPHTEDLLDNQWINTGYDIRHKTVNRLHDHNNLDIYGGPWLVDYGIIQTPRSTKINSLKEYAFSVAIENIKEDYYFSEKLIDCFRTGTVPIYYGCPSIDSFFNPDGMICFDNVDELKDILDNISMLQYKEMLPAVKENFDIAEKYILCEDYIYDQYKDILFP